MKLEILKKRAAVEIHLTNDDDSVTVWVCESEQAAMFKLATLIFSQDETPEQAKRSILVGTFSKKKAEPKRPELEDIAKMIAEKFAKEGMQPQQDLPVLNPPEEPPPAVPAILPYVQPMNPYGGQIIGISLPSTTDGVGTGEQPTIDVNVLGPNGSSAKSSGGDVDINQILDMMENKDSGKIGGCFGLVDKPIEDDDELVQFTGTYQASQVNAFHTTISVNP
jgi:hypothetical protein